MDLLSDLQEVWQGLSSPRELAPCRPRTVSSGGDVHNLAHAIRNPARTDPLVCITTQPGTSDELVLDPQVVWQELNGKILLYVIFEHHFVGLLNEALPPQLAIVAGKVRLWWPGAGDTSASAAHPVIAGDSEAKTLKRLKRAWRQGSRRR